jgi:hypothetical protein
MELETSGWILDAGFCEEKKFLNRGREEEKLSRMVSERKRRDWNEARNKNVSRGWQ